MNAGGSLQRSFELVPLLSENLVSCTCKIMNKGCTVSALDFGKYVCVSYYMYVGTVYVVYKVIRDVESLFLRRKKED